MDLFRRASAPVISPSPDVAWASGATFNPGADLGPDGTLRLLVRGVPAGYSRVETPEGATGEGTFLYEGYVSHLGLATRQLDGTFALAPEPLLSPDTDVDRYGVEDARVTRLNGTTYLTYTVLSEPAHAADLGVGIGLATTDWRTVERFGRIGPPVRDKDAALFPRLVGGKVAMLHRIVPDVQIALFEDEDQLRAPGDAFWERHLATLDEHVVLRPEAPWEGKKVGAGPPPIWTEEGWLLIYHAADADHVYRAGLALLDLDDPRRVIARTRRPAFEPCLAWEVEGDVPNVVFPQGAVVEDGTLSLYYGAADTHIGHATAPMDDVLALLHEEKGQWRVPSVYVDFRGHLDTPGELGAGAVPVERLHGGTPVLEPIADHAWESRVVLNPAAVLVDDAEELGALCDAWDFSDADRQRLATAGGACVMIYRAQGSAYERPTPHGRHVASALGLAVFTPDLQLVRRWAEPVIAPEASFHDLGVEDPRCTKVGDTYYLHYTGYTTDGPADPTFAGRVQLCLATTKDFLKWELHGPVEGDVNAHDDKNGALFPEPVDGRWYLWHRPVYGRHPMTMHLASAPTPDGPWTSRGMVLASRRFDGHAYSWVGAAGPPIALGNGRFLALYHQGHFSFDRTRLYNLSAALVAPAEAEPVLARVEPILLPEGDAERVGDPDLGVDDVVFSCAGYAWGDRLVVPYAGADSRIFGAVLDMAGLVETLEQQTATAPTL